MHDRTTGLGLVIPALLVVAVLATLAFCCIAPAAIVAFLARGFLRICDLVFALW